MTTTNFQSAMGASPQWEDSNLSKQIGMSYKVAPTNKITEDEATIFALIPNPANEIVQLKALDNHTWTGRIELVSPLGKVLYNTNVNEALTEQEIDISFLAAGMYYCRLWDSGGKPLFIGKLFVSH